MQKVLIIHFLLTTGLVLASCGNQKKKQNNEGPGKADSVLMTSYADIEKRLDQYVMVTLKSDPGHLSADQKKMLKKLIHAAKRMDGIFWKEAYGKKDELLKKIENKDLKKYVGINYGPWDRLKEDEPFIAGIRSKPLGANFYPVDMTREEFEKAELPDKKNLYTLIRRDETGNLKTIPYHEAFASSHKKAAQLLEEAAELAENKGFAKYLRLRARALLTGEYQKSDFAWLDMKDNKVDLVFGPIETYEDRLFGYKAAHEAFVLIKDLEWSKRLSRYVRFLPRLQEELPVRKKFKQEEPGRDAQLNVYDVIYCAGDANAGPKTIAINLPNDEEVQLKKGTRRLQLKNAMRAKFDKILVPISNHLIAGDQRKHITFEAFFSNTMFHEVAHGLGIKHTVNDKVPVREILKDQASALEEGKADILGLYMITKLHEWGEIKGDIKDYYITFMASIFRSVRFGASSAHGLANMLRFNYFKEMGAFVRQDNGTYRVNIDKLKEAMTGLTQKILTLQGTGDYKAVSSLMKEKGSIGPVLKKDLQRLGKAGIPVDIIYKQGVGVFEDSAT